MKTTPKKDRNRDDRIDLEIIPDAHDAEEMAMSWWNYLQDVMVFPFTASCIALREISPLEKKDEVDVIDLASGDESEHEIFVKIRRGKRGLAVPLSQVKPIGSTDAKTVEAVADWHYWVAQGRQFG